MSTILPVFNVEPVPQLNQVVVQSSNPIGIQSPNSTISSPWNTITTQQFDNNSMGFQQSINHSINLTTPQSLNNNSMVLRPTNNSVALQSNDMIPLQDISALSSFTPIPTLTLPMHYNVSNINDSVMTSSQKEIIETNQPTSQFTEASMPVEKQTSPLSSLSTTMPTPLINTLMKTSASTPNNDDLINRIIHVENNPESESENEESDSDSDSDSEEKNEKNEKDDELDFIVNKGKDKGKDKEEMHVLETYTIPDKTDNVSNGNTSALDSNSDTESVNDFECKFEEVESKNPLEIEANEKYIMEILNILSSRKSQHTNFAIFVSQLRHDYLGTCANRENIIKAVMLASEYNTCTDKFKILRIQNTDPVILQKICILQLQACNDVLVLQSAIEDLEDLSESDTIANAMFLISFVDFFKITEEAKITYQRKKDLILLYLIILKLLKNLSKIETVKILKEDLEHVKEDILRILMPLKIDFNNETICYNHIDEFFLLNA